MKEHSVFDFICGLVMGPVLAWVFMALGVMFIVEFLPAAKDKSESVVGRIYLFVCGVLSCIAVPVLLVWQLFERHGAIAGCITGCLVVWALVWRPQKKIHSDVDTNRKA